MSIVEFLHHSMVVISLFATIAYGMSYWLYEERTVEVDEVPVDVINELNKRLKRTTWAAAIWSFNCLLWVMMAY